MFDFERVPWASKRITAADFETMWKSPLSSFVKQKIEAADFRYRELSESELNRCRAEIKKALTSNLMPSGQHRHSAWVKGWGENADSLKSSGDLTCIKPRYFEKIPVVRWQGRWILPLSVDFEFHMFEVLQYWLFDRYFRDSTSLYEFGCGTGHNLLRARAVNPTMKLVGLDWAESSQEILRTLKEKKIETEIEGYHFDFFNPRSDLKLNRGADIMTLAALEQTGTRFESFLEFILKQNPRRIIHVEPIEELLNGRQGKEYEIDHSSIEYFHKRNYLQGYLKRLRELETEGLLTIERAERSWIGSFFIEGYSIVVWRPREQPSH